jgi:hypothetical protein
MLGGASSSEVDPDLFSDSQADDSLDSAVMSRFERFGIDLSDMESRMVEGVLHGFTQTAYKGNMPSTSKEEIAEQKNCSELPSTYKYLDRIPRLRATQNEILEWSGISRGSIAKKVRAIEALNELGRKQYCFFYDRLAYDDNGVPVKDRKGNWVKEDVVAIDTLFTIKIVKDSKRDRIKYYEITPSALFLDQRESYFMLVPNNWRQEVQALYGKKKASSYTFRFLMFLRYQYEIKRRSKHIKPPYEIKLHPDELASSIRISEHCIRRNRKRMMQLLDDAYSTAKDLGYLSDYRRGDDADTLVLNEDKYYDPGQKELVAEGTKSIEAVALNSEVFALLDFFVSQRQRIDPGYRNPKEPQLSKDLRSLQKLLELREMEEIKKVVKWSITKEYWCGRLSTPTRLWQHFSDAIGPMRLEASPTTREEDNRKMASEVLSCVESSVHNARVDMLHKYVEIGNGVTQPTIIEYSDRHFEQKLTEGLKRWGFQLCTGG